MRDAARLAPQQQGDIYAGMDLINTRRALRPEPLERPDRVGVTLNAGSRPCGRGGQGAGGDRLMAWPIEPGGIRA